MATDTILYTNGLASILAGNVLVTPNGGTQATLNDLVNGGTVAVGVNFQTYGSITPAGSNLATAPVVSAQITELGTAASTTGVALPPSGNVLGVPLLMINVGTAAVHVYSQGGDTIGTIAGTTGVTLTNGHRSFVTALAAGGFISGPSGTIMT